MKRLVCIIFSLLALYSNSSHALICPDGVSKAATDLLCPANLTNPSVGLVTTTSAQIIGYGDRMARGAKRHIYVSLSAYPPGCTSGNYTHADLSSPTPSVVQTAKAAKAACTRADLIKGNVGSSAYAEETLVDDGYFAKVVTGVAAGTTYYAHSLAAGGGCDAYPNYTQNCLRPSGVSLVQTIQFTTGSGGGGGGGEQLVADGGASARVIRPTGSNLADGLTWGTAWQTLPKVTCGLPAGTNVAIEAGTYSLQQLDICYDSTSNDWAIFGTAKLNGSSQLIWSVDNVFDVGSTDTKAKMLGGLTSGCITANNCVWTLASYQANGLPGGNYDYPLTITGNYVEVRNIILEKWHGAGWLASGEGGIGTTHHLIMDGVDTIDTGQAAYTLVDGFSDGVVKNSTHTNWGVCWMLKSNGNSGANSNYTCDGSAVPSVMGLVRSVNGRLLVEATVAYGGIGEGWDCGAKSSYMITRGNWLYGNSSASTYTDGCQWYISENNIIVANSKNGYTGVVGPGTGLGGSLALDIESWQGSDAHNTTNYLVRNNLVLFAGKAVSMGIGTAHDAAGKQVGIRMYGNTIIATTDEEFMQWPMSAGAVQVLEVKGNVFWRQSGTNCNVQSQFVADRNHFYTTPYDSDCIGTNLTTGDPQLTSAYPAASTYGPTNWPTHATFRPAVGSPLIGTGPVLEADLIPYLSFGFAATEIAGIKDNTFTLTDWAKQLKLTATNQVRDASPPKGNMCAVAGC